MRPNLAQHKASRSKPDKAEDSGPSSSQPQLAAARRPLPTLGGCLVLISPRDGARSGERSRDRAAEPANPPQPPPTQLALPPPPRRRDFGVLLPPASASGFLQFCRKKRHCSCHDPLIMLSQII
uniref:Uncharacterized protein n=1 Tax=Oryza punctata TaxID=4537 RepID=A0A0E0K8J7_ORYPU